MATPGILYVTMQPKPGLPIQQFHEWYNNEHGPTRLRLPQIFSNGLRYIAADGEQPTYLAVYDVTSMSQLETDTYTSLRENRSPREAETISQVDVKRYFWDLMSTKQSPLFMPIEQLTDDEAEDIVLVTVILKPTDAAGAKTQIQRWYDEEHLDLLSKIPGWLRSRVFKTSSLEKTVETSFIALHEFAKQNGIGGPEHQAAMATPWRQAIHAQYATVAPRRPYSLFYVFGPAPRDLQNLSQLEPASSTFKSADAKTVTSNDPAPVITSYVTAPDGLEIPYRLEGNPDPKAPTIAFCNSLLTSLHMWDPFVEILKAKRPQYRILRYDHRGRYAILSPATLDMLSDDLRTVTTALRIPKLAALIGVSLGGATALRFALAYPDALDRFVACDFNAASSAANTDAWKQRIAVADSEAGIATLAAQTVARWFHPATMAGKPDVDVVAWMTDMAAANDVQGFRHGCRALWDYDMRGAMRECRVPALLVVGEGDGKGALVKAMEGFKGLLGETGAKLAVVPETGHLPMCENPGGFWEAVEGFL
ncbi:Alpha/Beta hydrolase protein [Xylariaceae sp. FL0662B]|nr:Alpha/Beta hydrolase protein [Xylariaceae sp. FL0662B]